MKYEIAFMAAFAFLAHAAHAQTTTATPAPPWAIVVAELTNTEVVPTPASSHGFMSNIVHLQFTYRVVEAIAVNDPSLAIPPTLKLPTYCEGWNPRDADGIQKLAKEEARGNYTILEISGDMQNADFGDLKVLVPIKSFDQMAERERAAGISISRKLHEIGNAAALDQISRPLDTEDITVVALMTLASRSVYREGFHLTESVQQPIIEKLTAQLGRPALPSWLIQPTLRAAQDFGGNQHTSVLAIAALIDRLARLLDDGKSGSDVEIVLARIQNLWQVAVRDSDLKPMRDRMASLDASLARLRKSNPEWSWYFDQIDTQIAAFK